MALNLVTFEDKQNLNTKPEVARINKVTDEDMNELKGIINDIVPVVNTFINDLVIDGEPITTGNIVGGKPEYVKRISLNQFPNATSKTFSTGISNATWVRHFVYMNASNEWHLLPYHSLAALNAGVIAKVSNDASTVTIDAGTDRSSLNGVAEVYFTYNS